MTTPTERTISFRNALAGEILDFLEAEGVMCAQTAALLVALTGKLASYREEDQQLSPEVYCCDTVSDLGRVLQGVEVIVLGSADRTETAAEKVLKDCARLAHGAWAIFIERGNTEKFRYGVFSAPNVPLSITPEEAVLEGGGAGIFAVGIRRLADNCVELHGWKGNHRRVNFSSERADTPSPRLAAENLAKAITRRVDGPHQQSVYRFCYRTLSAALQKSRGSLVAVLPKSALDNLVSLGLVEGRGYQGEVFSLRI